MFTYFYSYRALKNAITALLAGETMPRVLMTVIRFAFLQNNLFYL